MMKRINTHCATHAVLATSLLLALVACGGASDRQAVSDADLVVTLTLGDSQSVIIGDLIVHEIRVTNTGGRPATGVALTDDLGPDLALISAATANGSCPQAAVLTCSLPDLAAQESATVQITTVARATGVLVQHVTVNSAAAEADSSTNQLDLVATVTLPHDRVPHVVAIPSSAVIAVNDTVALSAAQYASDGTPEPGGTATWTSSAESVATVGPTGVVTGIAWGTATVVASMSGVESQE
ncbi:MAG: Ig-like domain-containing protein, partial [Nitrospiria bacterium]